MLKINFIGEEIFTAFRMGFLWTFIVCFFYVLFKNLYNNFFSCLNSSCVIFFSCCFSCSSIVFIIMFVFSFPLSVNSTIFLLLFVGSSFLFISSWSSKFLSIFAVYPLLTLNRLTKSFCVVLSLNLILSRNLRLFVVIISSFKLVSANSINDESLQIIF